MPGARLVGYRARVGEMLGRLVALARRVGVAAECELSSNKSYSKFKVQIQGTQLQGTQKQGNSRMWRSFFMATGVALCIVGAECMVVDRFVLADSITKSTPYIATEEYTPSWETDLTSTTKRRAFVPPEWAPWGLLSSGVMLVLYTASFPPSQRKRYSGDDD